MIIKIVCLLLIPGSWSGTEKTTQSGIYEQGEHFNPDRMVLQSVPGLDQKDVDQLIDIVSKNAGI